MSVAPPRPKGPPLNALRAFEASARLGGFAGAAEELCVTPGAIAQQVKNLEAWAGAPLFERRAQGVRLTPLGRAAAAELRAAFDRLAGATVLLRSLAAPQEIRIATLPSIAQLWLSPRLPEIRRASPQLSISVTALERPPNLTREAFDLAIFFGIGRDGGTRTLILAEDDLFPVCAPEIAARLRQPADLRGETLLHDASWRDDWRDWLAGSGAEDAADRPGPTYSLYSLAVEEAIHGAGVLIGHAPLVARAMESGLLVAPFRRRIRGRGKLAVQLRESAPDGSPLVRLAQRLAAPWAGAGTRAVTPG